MGSQYRTGIYYTDEADLPVIQAVVQNAGAVRGIQSPSLPRFCRLKTSAWRRNTTRII